MFVVLVPTCQPPNSLPFQIWTSPEEGAAGSGPSYLVRSVKMFLPALASEGAASYLYENALVCATGAVSATLIAREQDCVA